MKQNIYLVKIISRRDTHYDLYRTDYIGIQVVFGKKQLDKILELFPDSEWECIEYNGEE